MYSFRDAQRTLDIFLHETSQVADKTCRLKDNLDLDRIVGDQPTFPFLFQVGILVPERARILTPGEAARRSRGG